MLWRVALPSMLLFAISFSTGALGQEQGASGGEAAPGSTTQVAAPTAVAPASLAASPSAATTEPSSIPSLPAPAPAALALPDDASGAAALLDDEHANAADSLLNGETLKLYGFGDVGYRQMLVPKTSPWLVYFNRHPSLFVGHLNLYLDSQLAERWRALTEVRFTYLPQGSWQPNDSGTVTHADWHGADYTDFTRDRSLGSIMIERAFIEYDAAAWLSVQAGQWLTPYGVWNIDHGSPVIIGVSPPFLVGARLLPQAQVGLLGYGRVSVMPDLELSYALGLSNGRTELSAYEDLDDNKAVTARLALTYRGLGELTVGSSAYVGQASDNSRALYFDDGVPKSREDAIYRLSERAHAFDLRWIWRDLHVQGEAIVREQKYEEDGRPPLDDGFEPDQRQAGGYALIGYRTPLAGIMPYVKGEYSPDPALRVIGITEHVMVGTAGLNFRPVPRVVFKAEYNYGFFPDAEAGTFADNYIAALDLQIAWAF